MGGKSLKIGTFLNFLYISIIWQLFAKIGTRGKFAHCCSFFLGRNRDSWQVQCNRRLLKLFNFHAYFAHNTSYNVTAKLVRGLLRPSNKYCRQVTTALGIEWEETGDWNGSSPDTNTRNIHELNALQNGLFHYMHSDLIVMHTVLQVYQMSYYLC